MAGKFIGGLTAFGRAVMAKGITGEPIKVTAIVMGSGRLPEGASTDAIKAVVEPVVTLSPLADPVVADGTALISGLFTNDQAKAGFYFRELAVLVEDAELGVGVYSYGSSGDKAEWIPPTEDAIVEKKIDIAIAVGAAASVTAVIPQDVYALREELTDHDGTPEAHPALRETMGGLDVRLRSLQNEVETLRDSVLNNMVNNVFVVNFDTLESVNLARGIYDLTGRKIYV